MSEGLLELGKEATVTTTELNIARGDLLVLIVDARDGNHTAALRAWDPPIIARVQADATIVDLRTVDALVARLRRKLISHSGRPVITTVTGVGYRIALDDGS